MEVQTELLRESRRRSEIIAQRLVDLQGFITEAGPKAALSHAELAERLLRRAPIEFLEQHGARDLVHMAQFVSVHVEKFIESKSAVTVGTEKVAGRTAIVLVVSDRPFIVNTVMECCREDGVRIRTLLHPVMPSTVGPLSINYLEIDEADKEVLEGLLTKLTEALTHLLPVTDDYKQIVARLGQIRVAMASAAGVAEQESRSELVEFAEWLTQGHFNFFGAISFQGKDAAPDQAGAQGLCKGTDQFTAELLSELKLDVGSLQKGAGIIFFNSLLTDSPVHRRTRLSSITIREATADGAAPRFTSFVGLFTSKAVTQECSSIPFIRQKFRELIRLEGFAENTHDFKSAENIIDSLPKETTLGLDLQSLQLIVNSVLGVATSSETVTSVWPDQEGRGVYVLVVMTRSRFDSGVRQSIEHYLERLFKAHPITNEHHLDITNRPVVRLYFYVPTSVVTLKGLRVDEVRGEISALARSWNEELQLALTQRYKNGAVATLMDRYEEAFAEGYRASQTALDCVEDISQIEALSATAPVQVALANPDPVEPHTATLVVYSMGEDITISQAVPVLENFGFSVINERAWKIRPSGRPTVTSNRFRVKTRSGNPINVERFKMLVPPAMVQAFRGGKDNDILNTLCIEAGLDLRAVSVVRGYCRFLWQVKRFASRFSIYRTVAQNPSLALRLWNLFEIRFNPASKASIQERATQAQDEAARFVESLRGMKDINTDRTFRALLMLLEHTVRTNFYQGHEFLALKFRSDAIDIMPQPRPMFEIFVHSPKVEGVHLRSGMVARGGIRWSDRVDDYRSEVLGLMKTQRIKNALIVPTGAKGGFIVKNLPADQKLVPAAVQEAYSEYIRAMLSIADTRKDGQVVRPAQVLAYEGDDPYFVVAADKGTATFSDVANRLAVTEFDFWLGDAFASGGSNGYDHKKYGITAKGGWECVQRHFRDLGMEFEMTPFTAVGVGDMAGDVFGNGLLLSRQFKLLAAFNHKHIFLDPNPDPERSFEERTRLFELKGSQWSDYNPAVLSVGGGIFERFAKEIPLSQEVRRALGIDAEVPAAISGEALINLILKAPVDLLWNGGIGTYVKSRLQSHAEVSDSANDAVRINADELRCRVIGEGGNLGLTQLARIEAARGGVALNTDAIDNSGGVDLSDHEVNLKIFFSRLMQEKRLSIEERNTVLREMAHEVCESVLDHNRSHALLLSIAAASSAKSIPHYQALLRDLVKLGLVNRALDNLPDDDELQDRQEEGLGLTRPELAVCVATTKMWVKDLLLASDFLEDPTLHELLLEYFPKTVQERWGKEIPQHPLARNILASQIANTLVDGIGITQLHQMSVHYGVQAVRVIECAVAAELMLGTRHLRSQLIAGEPSIGTAHFRTMVDGLSGALVEATGWLLNRHGSAVRLASLVERYRKSWRELSSEVLPGEMRQRYNARKERLVSLKLSAERANSLCLAPEVASMLDLLWCAQQSGRSFADAALVYSTVTEQLMLDALIRRCRDTEPRNRWDGELLVGTEGDIRGSAAGLTMQILAQDQATEPQVIAFLQQAIALDRWRTGVAELIQRAPEVSSLAVLARQLQGFARV